MALLQLNLCERRTRQMTMFTEECLYVRPHLVPGEGNRRRRRDSALRTIGLGEVRRRPLYNVHSVGTLCAARR